MISFCYLVPIDASDAVRRFVETLFITHTEAKLNTCGRLLQEDDDDDNNDNNTPVMLSNGYLIDRGEWCRNIAYHP